LLAAFLKAPHNPVGDISSIRVASPIARLKAKIRFGDEAVPDDDKLTLKANFTLPPSSSFDVADATGPTGKAIRVLDEVVTISLADVDEEVVEIIVPAGSMRANGSETRFKLMDPAAVPGLRRLVLKRRGVADIQVSAAGKTLELATLDKDHITVAVEIGDDAFVKTRTFNSKGDRKSLRE
jgi:hypothetical protein